MFYEHDYFVHPNDPNYTLRAGLVHQSNGEDGPESRSWDRFYVHGILHSPHWFDPDLGPAEIKNLLAYTARDITVGQNAHGKVAGPGPDGATGFGLADATRAIDAVL